jgi:hypothetical protein
MNNTFKNLKNIVILLLIGVVVTMQMCQPTPPDMKEYIKIGGKKYELLSKKRDTVFETVHDTIPKYVPKWYPKKEIEYVDVPADVDTLAILKDYYTKYSYKDTVQVSTYGEGIISDEVTQNRIVSREILWDLDIPIVKETITVKELPKNQLYFGGGIGIDKVDFINNAKAGLLWKTKQDKIYGLHIGLSNRPEYTFKPIVPYIEGSMYWKIRLGKK